MNDDLERRINLAETLTSIKENLKTNTDMTEKIHDILFGDNGDGLRIKVALNRSNIKRLWWIVSTVSVGILGVAFYIIRSNLS